MMKHALNILVTGGAGYIGSHTVRQLVEANQRVVVLDNFYSGHSWAIAEQAHLVEGNAGDTELVTRLIEEHDINAVIHFAGHIVVPESVTDPLKYYRNNSVVSHALIDTCRKCGVNQFVFSSTAAVYGLPDAMPISEDTPAQPINPYGTSKLVTEFMLRDLAFATRDASEPFRYVALRYFNVAGAHVGGEIGQSTPEATHLIKIASEVAIGKRDAITVYGTDYPTPDGTCVRDYIHVDDLAAAHLKALDYLGDQGDSAVLNCGYSHGYSVREVLDSFVKVSGVDIKINTGPRRAGDAIELVADTDRIRSTLGWSPQYDDLELICKTAYDWEKKLADKQT